MLLKHPTDPTPSTQHYFEYLAYAVHSSHQTDNPFDILTLRKKAQLSVRDLVNFAIAFGYTEIILNACRALLSEEGIPIYDAEQTVVLDQPIFQSWQQIREYNELQSFLT